MIKVNENEDPMDAYDREHGAPGPDHAPINEAEAWGTKQNPVQETPPAYTGLK